MVQRAGLSFPPDSTASQCRAAWAESFAVMKLMTIDAIEVHSKFLHFVIIRWENKELQAGQRETGIIVFNVFRFIRGERSCYRSIPSSAMFRPLPTSSQTFVALLHFSSED